MDFFNNIGTGELVFLVLLAILLVGPKRAVGLVQQGGRFLARIQQEWRSVQRDVMAEMRALQQETLSAVDPGLQELTAEVKALQQETLAAGGEPPAPTGAVTPGEDKAG